MLNSRIIITASKVSLRQHKATFKRNGGYLYFEQNTQVIDPAKGWFRLESYQFNPESNQPYTGPELANMVLSQNRFLFFSYSKKLSTVGTYQNQNRTETCSPIPVH